MEDELVCYCFEYSKQDIERDYLKNGRSDILDSIVVAKKALECNCSKNHPLGR